MNVSVSVVAAEDAAIVNNVTLKLHMMQNDVMKLKICNNLKTFQNLKNLQKFHPFQILDNGQTF